MRADFRKATDAFVRQVTFTRRTETALIDRIAEDMASAPPEVALSALGYLPGYDFLMAEDPVEFNRLPDRAVRELTTR